MKYLLFCLLLSTVLYTNAEETIKISPEIEKLLIGLNDENFDAREVATYKLATYPDEYAEIFYKLSASQEDLEVKHRLVLTTKYMFYNSIVKKNRDWQRLHGTFDIGNEWYRGKILVVGFGVDCKADVVLKKWDLILDIYDPDMNNASNFGVYWGPVPNDKYKMRILRYKDVPDTNDIEEYISFADAHGGDKETYEILEVNVEATTKRELPFEAIARREDILWQEWLDRVNGIKPETETEPEPEKSDE